MRLGRLLLAALLGLVLVGSLTTAVHADPRWVFYTKDKTRYESPWFKGAHRVMVPYGCTTAPYYSPDSRCRDRRGFHHGLDIAMRCGTPLYAARRFKVVSNDTLGPAYGEQPAAAAQQPPRLGPGDRPHPAGLRARGAGVKRGTMFARAGDSGAPDGCHLHFEQRAVGGGLSTATWPRPLLALTPREQ